MIDKRQFDRKASELLDSNKPVKLRLVLDNGNMVERIISPVIVKFVIKCYRDQKFVYKPIKEPITDVQNVSMKNLRLIQKLEMPSIKTDGCPVKNLISELLQMKYEPII